MRSTIFLAALLTPAAALAVDSEFEGRLRELAAGTLAGIAADPVFVEAVRVQNARHIGLTQAQIDAMDATWAAEVGAPHAPMINGILERPASLRLQEVSRELEGLVTEAFLVDAHGLNVAQSSVTSDYWQGDEDKWRETYLRGPRAVHISEIDLDESSQTYQSQVSIAVVDPLTSLAIGAVTFGVDVARLD
jgi:hypothetical protein